MRFEFTVHIAAPAARVWSVLVDPASVRGCVPGLESLAEIALGETYRAVVAFPLAQRQVRCVADVSWLERQAPRQAALAVMVSLAEAPAGSDALAILSRLSLRDELAGRTCLHWLADLDLQGNLAGMPPQLLVPLIRKQGTLFLGCLKGAVESGA